MPAVLQNPMLLDVPAEWERQLAELSPRSDRFVWLKLIWEQGYPWEIIERYMIYEMIPERVMLAGGRNGKASLLHANVLEQLRHPLPPSQMGNYFDVHLNNGEGEFVLNPDCLITERAWHLYRATGCWGRPYWVIQGEKGGHKRWFSDVESKLLRAKGLPPRPPEPSELPYAPFDERVRAQLVKHDVLKGRHDGLARQRTLLHGAHSARHAAEARAVREELVKWLTEQVSEFAPEAHRALKALDMGPRRGPVEDVDTRTLDRRAEQAVQNYLETGKSHGGANPLRLI